MTEWTCKVTRSMNRIYRHPAGYLQGDVVTPYGIVVAYSQGGADEYHSTNLQMVQGGRLYSVSFNRKYTQRGIATLANRFARNIAQRQK